MQFMPLHRTQEIARYVHASGKFPPYEFASSIVGFDTSAAALTAHAETTAVHAHSIPSVCSENISRSRNSLKRLSDNSTAQTDPDKAEYADAPNPNPAGESDIV